MDNNMVQTIANAVKTTPERVMEEATAILEKNGATWAAAGKDDATQQVQALRIAQINISRSNAALARTGADNFVGMFISVPRAKKWGEILYNKMKRDLGTMTPAAIDALIRAGSIVHFEESGGEYIRKINPSLLSGQPLSDGIAEDTLSELPKHVMQYDASNHFGLIEDNKTPTFPSGDKNFRYGRIRDQSERERTCLFVGRKEGDNGAPSLFRVRANGAQADALYPPAYVAGRIPLKAARNGNTLYAVRNVTEFSADESVQSIFSAPPLVVNPEGADEMFGGVIAENVHQIVPVSGMADWHDQNFQTDGWYDMLLGVVGEVIHMEPKDNDAVLLMLGDEDMSSLDTLEVWVSGAHSAAVDFGVGSKVVAVGQTWQGQEGDTRFSCSGWFAYETVEAIVSDFVPEDTDGEEW